MVYQISLLMLILKTNSINDSLNLPGTYCLKTCWSTLCKKNTIKNEKIENKNA